MEGLNMRRSIVYAALAVFLTGATAAMAAQEYPATQEALDAEVMNLPWEDEPGSYAFEDSNSTFTLPEGYSMLRGDAARRMMFLNQGIELPNTEAYLYNNDLGTEIDFSFNESGFVSLDDWEDIDPDGLLQSIIDTAETENAERRKNGVSEIYIKAWIQPPTLDRDSKSIHWALDVMDEGSQMRIVNAVALKLGRRGYEMAVWVGTLEQYQDSNELRVAALDNHDFQPGSRFADYTTGDKLAGFGIASLVAVTAGANSNTAKAGAAGLIAAAVAFGKKFIIVPILLAFGAVGAFFRSRLGFLKARFKRGDADAG
jgi:uncharacterized membrane-anchored protein